MAIALDCEAAAKYLRHKADFWSADDTCVADYLDEGIREDLRSTVGCDEKCSAMHVEREDIEECVEGCEEAIKLASKGSVLFDKRTLEVREATIPVSCTVFMEDENGLEWSERAQRRLFGKLTRIGCSPLESWIHPHEFVRGWGEVEEEPAVCYVHVKQERGCRLPDLMAAFKR
jgi:hypothetical protein